MRASRSTAVALALIAIVMGGRAASAHRRDELLQAARIDVGPARVDVALDLTPGIALAGMTIGDIDRDRDGSLSTAEQRDYAAGVLRAMHVEVDGQRLTLARLESTFPALDTFRRGEGTIQLRASVAVRHLSEGAHQLVLRNTHRPDVSVYLANALVPASDALSVTRQRRSADQRELTIDYVVRATSSGRVAWGGIVGVAMLAGLLARSRWFSYGFFRGTSSVIERRRA